MIFKANRQNFSVYDSKVDKCVAEFIDYKFETQDETLITRLQELGYEIEVTKEPLEEVKPKGKKVKQ